MKSFFNFFIYFIFIPCTIILFQACCKDNNNLNLQDYPSILNVDCTIDTTKLLCHYPFNGNAMDISNFANHGLIKGPKLTQDRFFNKNGAYLFDGKNDEIRIEDKEQLYLDNNFTITVWILPKEIKSQQIIRKGSNVNGSFSHPYGLSLSGTNEVVFSITTTNGELKQARKKGYDLNKWSFIAGVLDGNIMKLYVDGKIEAIETINGGIIDDPLQLLIGTRLNLPADTFNGAIDDVSIFGYALNEEDLSCLSNN